MQLQLVLLVPSARTLAGMALCGMALVCANPAHAQVARYHGTPMPTPMDCRNGGCGAPGAQATPPSTPAVTAASAAAAMAGYWAANNHVSFLIFSTGNGVARLVEVVDGQVTRDRQATFAEAGADVAKPGHLIFNMALQTTAVDNATADNINVEFYRGLHTIDMNLSPDRHVRLWFVRKTDQMDVDALEHPRLPTAHSGSLADSPEPPQRLSTRAACPESRAWQATLSYPAQALRAGVTAGSVTLDFIARPDGSTAEYRVEVATNEYLIGPTLEALAHLRCPAVSAGQWLQQIVDYKTE